jgi:hypothetical protein
MRLNGEEAIQMERMVRKKQIEKSWLMYHLRLSCMIVNKQHHFNKNILNDMEKEFKAEFR